jgi:hypothetical protein
MKEKAKRIEHKFKMPHLFLDDLETIENTIKKEFPQSKYKLETKELEFESLSEIPKNLSMTRNFYISVRNDSESFYSRIDVNFHQWDASISTDYYDDAKTFGLFNKIVEIISKRERKLLYWWLKLNPFMVGLLFISAQISVELLVHKKQKNAIFVWLLIAMLLASICCCFVEEYINTRKFSIIEFVHKKEKPNFFKRNKDSIIIVIIGAILGSLFTLIAEFIIKLF